LASADAKSSKNMSIRNGVADKRPLRGQTTA
jgi:hypothetical protein